MYVCAIVSSSDDIPTSTIHFPHILEILNDDSKELTGDHTQVHNPATHLACGFDSAYS
ncbi:hypothetical protein BofuT4_uP034810.1 [Botrytis cinerea T4]|uniref:Uncharacterized protein n=1 Tax=Botryotinia fuckeliana (strain T4) TaxID=999810 RepID=G2Y7R9_BOTF4|nr:hypothetical protein BofuT4_uP034810.1 [Botrytis cinerea T4]